jgi:hypothetical protein
MKVGFSSRAFHIGCVENFALGSRCSVIHTEHINSHCGQSADFVSVKYGGT